MYREKPSVLFSKYAFPQMVGLLLNSVYLIVDGIFIGNRLGRDAMAAAAVAVPAIEILIAISLAVSAGAGVIISHKMGSGQYKPANEIFNLSAIVLAGVSLVIAALGNIFLSPLASLLGATSEIHGQAVTYLWYILTFSPFLLFSFFLSGLARCDNRPKLAMTALAVGSVSNIVLDYVFMYPLNMGIAGAALATALGPIFSVLILLPHFIRKRGFLHFKWFRPDWRKAVTIISLGLPAFIMEFTIGIVTFLYNFAIIQNGYGEIGLASYLIIGYLALMILTCFLGIAQGLQPVFSYLDGAGDAERGRNLLHFSVKVVLSIGVLAYGFVLLLSQQFIAVFTPGDPELLRFTYEKGLLYFWGILFAGFNILFISFWQALKQTKSAMAVSLLRSILALPVLIAVLPFFFGSESIWYCFSLCEALTASAALLIYLQQRKKARRNPLEEYAIIGETSGEQFE